MARSTGAGEGRAGRTDQAVAVLIGLSFGLAVVARVRLGDDWGEVARWLPLAPTLAVAAWEHRVARRGHRARRVVWVGLAATIASVAAGLALLRVEQPAGPGTEALAVLVVALPMVVAAAVLGGD